MKRSANFILSVNIIVIELYNQVPVGTNLRGHLTTEQPKVHVGCAYRLYNGSMKDKPTKNMSEFDPNMLEEIVVVDYSEPDVIKSIYSPTLFPHLKLTTNAVSRDIEVVVISTENEDKQLLHKLLTETRTMRKYILN